MRDMQQASVVDYEDHPFHATNDMSDTPNLMEEEPLADRDIRVVIEDTTTTLRNPQTIEVAVCVMFLVASLVLPTWAVPLHKRYLHYQILQSTGEVVYDSTHMAPAPDHQSVPTQLLIVLAVFLPLGIQLGLVFYWHHRMASVATATITTSLPQHTSSNTTLCIYCVAIGVTSFATGFVKNYCGYLRPSYYDLCGVNDDDCGADAHRSFPSGHASLSFCGLYLLTLYIRRNWGTGPQPQHRLIAMAGLIFPMGLATFIAASRVVDNKHFPADVVGGAVLGLMVAQYCDGVWNISGFP